MIQIRLIKPLKGVVVRYEAELIARDAASVAVRAAWVSGPVDLGIFRIEPGDRLDEYYYADRWYNIFRLHAPDGRLKGWYCNVARPALLGDDYVDSEDLELDLIVAADRGQVRLDDEEEFLARDLERQEPEAYRAAWAAVGELRGLVAGGAPPFDRT